VTLTLSSDDLESYLRECLIDLNKYHYLVCSCVVFHCGRTDGRIFLPSLLGHLAGDDDLITCEALLVCFSGYSK